MYFFRSDNWTPRDNPAYARIAQARDALDAARRKARLAVVEYLRTGADVSPDQIHDARALVEALREAKAVNMPHIHTNFYGKHLTD